MAVDPPTSRFLCGSSAPRCPVGPAQRTSPTLPAAGLSRPGPPDALGPQSGDVCQRGSGRADAVRASPLAAGYAEPSRLDVPCGLRHLCLVCLFAHPVRELALGLATPVVPLRHRRHRGRCRACVLAQKPTTMDGLGAGHLGGCGRQLLVGERPPRVGGGRGDLHPPPRPPPLPAHLAGRGRPCHRPVPGGVPPPYPGPSGDDLPAQACPIRCLRAPLCRRPPLRFQLSNGPFRVPHRGDVPGGDAISCRLGTRGLLSGHSLGRARGVVFPWCRPDWSWAGWLRSCSERGKPVHDCFNAPAPFHGVACSCLPGHN